MRIVSMFMRLAAMGEYGSQQTVTSCNDVVVGCLEIAGIPRIGDILVAAGKLKKLEYAVVGFGAEHAAHVSDVRLVHANQVIPRLSVS